MNTAHQQHWLELLQVSCDGAGLSCVDIIVDQAGSETSLLPSVLSVEPALPWHSLFSGLPEAGADDLAPLLVRVDLAQPLQRQWLLGLMHALEGRSQLLALLSHWPFHAVAEHLGQCLEARAGGRPGLLRFYDPRLFPLLFSDVLQPEQQRPLRLPAVLWSWLDRDGTPRCLSGVAEAPGGIGALPPIELNGSQLDTLCCASEATLAVASLTAAFHPDWDKERCFQTCYLAMLEATTQGLLTTAQREAYTLEKLSNAG